jgi:hypothetical protein
MDGFRLKSDRTVEKSAVTTGQSGKGASYA